MNQLQNTNLKQKIRIEDIERDKQSIMKKLVQTMLNQEKASGKKQAAKSPTGFSDYVTRVKYERHDDDYTSGS